MADALSATANPWKKSGFPPCSGRRLSSSQMRLGFDLRQDGRELIHSSREELREEGQAVLPGNWGV